MLLNINDILLDGLAEHKSYKTFSTNNFTLTLPVGQESRHSRFSGQACRVAVLAVRFVIGEMKDGFPSSKRPVRVP